MCSKTMKTKMIVSRLEEQKRKTTIKERIKKTTMTASKSLTLKGPRMR